MPHYGTLREYRFEGNTDDIRGSAIYGRDDEKLGKLDDVIFDHSSGAICYAVVDTGGWLSSKKFVVPTERIRESAEHHDAYETDLSKTQIESFPPYNEKDVASEERWKSYEERYKAGWHDGPVMHRKGSDHAVTPKPDEIPPVKDHAVDYEPQAVNRRVIPAAGDEVEIPTSGAGIGGRWSGFEDLLRRRREHVTSSCSICSGDRNTSRHDEAA